MAYAGYYSNILLRHALGNTIGANFEDDQLEASRRYADEVVDTGTKKEGSYPDTGSNPAILHAWTPTDRYFGEVIGISQKFAIAHLRSTQINVSIQSLREYQQAEKDLARFANDLITLGLVQQTGRIATDQFVTDVLNPVTGTRVTGLHGIVPSRRTSWESALYVP